MKIKPNKAFKPLYENYNNPNIRFFLLWGGRSGGRSFEASTFTVFCMKHLSYFRGTCMRLIHSTLKDSSYQEIVDRLNEHGLTDYFEVMRSPMRVQYGDKKLDFKAFKTGSSDQTAKLKSLASYNFVWIEEAEEVYEEDFQKLVESLRKKDTRIIVILTFNPPVKDHWINKRWFDLVPSEVENFYQGRLKKSLNNTVSIHTTYLDNYQNINEASIQEFEVQKEVNPYRYNHIVKGLIPTLKTGLIFDNYTTISKEEFLDLPYSSKFGMDFGWNDPTTVQQVKLHDNNIYIHELIYSSQLSVDGICSELDRLGLRDKQITADSQAKQTIESINMRGFCLSPSQKGKDSIMNGIQRLQGMNIYITEFSKGILEEARNYEYDKDKSKNLLKDQPKDEWNHGWDAVRYAIEESTNGLSTWLEYM